MKKLIVSVFILVGLSCVAKADAIVFPTTAQNAFLGDEIIITLANHGTFAEEYRHGQKQIILSDNIIEAGHINNQYIFAADGSVYQNPNKTHLDYEAGLRLNLHAIVNKFVTLTPEWQMVFGNLEYYPRVGYDFGLDNTHAWIATFNLGFGFGAGSGTGGQQVQSK